MTAVGRFQRGQGKDDPIVEREGKGARPVLDSKGAQCCCTSEWSFNKVDKGVEAGVQCDGKGRNRKKHE